MVQFGAVAGCATQEAGGKSGDIAEVGAVLRHGHMLAGQPLRMLPTYKQLMNYLLDPNSSQTSNQARIRIQGRLEPLVGLTASIRWAAETST